MRQVPTRLDDVGLAVDGRVLADGAFWSLAAAGFYRVPAGEAAEAMGSVLCRERRDEIRVWGRITVDGLDWRIRRPAARIKARRLTGKASVFETLAATLPAQEAVEALVSAEERERVRGRMEGWMRELDIELSLDAGIRQLGPAGGRALELLRAALAEPALVWVDEAAADARALEPLAARWPVVLVGEGGEGAAPLPLEIGPGDPPPAPPAWLRWIVDRRLGGMRRPGAMGDLAGDIDALVSLSVTHVVGLEETPVARAELLASGIEHRHFPVVDMEAPELEATRALVGEVLKESNAGETVVFHCKAGLGRTGTLLACCLIESGYSRHQALGLLRQLRPEYVQSDVQHRFIERYAEATR